MSVKNFLMIALCCCDMSAMNLPVARSVEPFDSSLSFKLAGINSPLGIVQQQLTDIVLVKNLYFKEKFYNDNETSTTCMIFSPNGELLLCGSGKNIYFWDTQSWKLRKSLSLDTTSDVHALAFNKNGEKIIIGGNTGKNNLTILTQKIDGSYVRELSGHKKGAISCVGFSPDGMRAVSVCKNKLKIWDIFKGNVIHTYRGKSWSNCKVEYDQYNGWFLTGCDDVLGWWFSYDLNSGKKIIIPLQGKILPRIKAYDRSPCGNYIFLGGAEMSKVFVFNVRTKKYVHTIAPDGMAISAIACSSDGKLIISVTRRLDGSDLYLYSTVSREDQKALQTVYCIANGKLELVQRLIDEVVIKKKARLGDADHVTFDGLPFLLKVLLQKHVVTEESMEEHDFTMINCTDLIEINEGDDWTFI